MTDKPINRRQGAAAARKAKKLLADRREDREHRGGNAAEAPAGPGPDVGDLVVPPTGTDQDEDEGTEDGDDEQDQSGHAQGSTRDDPPSTGTGPQDHGEDSEEATDNDPEDHVAPYAHLEAQLVTLGLRVDELRSGPEWQAWLRQAARFHKYSFGNRILIALQNPQATHVAGYRTWRTMGRQVRRGEKGLRIMAPRTGKDSEGDPTVFGFMTVAVFDVSQTDGDPLAEHPPWPEADACPEGLLDELTHKVWTQLGMTTRFINDPQAEGHDSETRGWYTHATKEITLVSTFAEPELVATFLHELAHHLDHDRTTTYRDGELVAESAAYLAGGELSVGIDKEAEAYTASWATKGTDLLALADRSLTAAEAILDLVRPQEVAA